MLPHIILEAGAWNVLLKCKARSMNIVLPASSWCHAERYFTHFCSYQYLSQLFWVWFTLTFSLNSVIRMCVLLFIVQIMFRNVRRFFWLLYCLKCLLIYICNFLPGVSNKNRSLFIALADFKCSFQSFLVSFVFSFIITTVKEAGNYYALNMLWLFIRYENHMESLFKSDF